MFQVLNSKQQLILHAICHVVVALLLARFYYEYAGADEKEKKKFQTLIHSFTTQHTLRGRFSQTEASQAEEISDADEQRSRGWQTVGKSSHNDADQAQPCV